MTLEALENEVFQKMRPDFEKLAAFGFQKAKKEKRNRGTQGGFVLRREIMNGDFYVELRVSEDGTVNGKIFDSETGGEYLPARIPSQTGPFVSAVRSAYRLLLEEVTAQCFVPLPFVPAQDGRCWIIPANPKVFDLEAAFEQSDHLTWRQTRRFKAGDTIYIYMTEPVAAVLYRCGVIRTDILEEGEKVILIQRLRKYDRAAFTRSMLRQYGVRGVRSPRGVPETLRLALEAL